MVGNCPILLGLADQCRIQRESVRDVERTGSMEGNQAVKEQHYSSVTTCSNVFNCTHLLYIQTLILMFVLHAWKSISSALMVYSSSEIYLYNCIFHK